jgi:hypothetical protein
MFDALLQESQELAAVFDGRVKRVLWGSDRDMRSGLDSVARELGISVAATTSIEV